MPPKRIITMFYEPAEAAALTDEQLQTDGFDLCKPLMKELKDGILWIWQEPDQPLIVMRDEGMLDAEEQ